MPKFLSSIVQNCGMGLAKLVCGGSRDYKTVQNLINDKSVIDDCQGLDVALRLAVDKETGMM